jgi:hypothetical protein
MLTPVRQKSILPSAANVTFTLPGFATVVREGLELSGTFAATVDAELRVGGLEETVLADGRRPPVGRLTVAG